VRSSAAGGEKPMEPEKTQKGKWTFRIASFFFFLSVLLEALPPTSPVLLFGAVRAGVAAGIYHGLYGLLYAGLGIGLWRARPWAYKLVLLTTLIYTIDVIQGLLSPKALGAFLRLQLGGHEDLLQLVDFNLILQAFMGVKGILVAGWWGFALYTYLRRRYFQPA
jgi:Predicted membrane protein (DUF2127)